MARRTFWERYEGPFFQGDPGRKVADNLHDFMADVIYRASEVARAAAPYHRGELISHIQGRMSSRAGRRWRVTGIVSTWGLGADERNGHRGNWPGTRRARRLRTGGPYFNYAGKAEARYHFMRKGRQSILDARRANRDLLRGLN